MPIENFDAMEDMLEEDEEEEDYEDDYNSDEEEKSMILSDQSAQLQKVPATANSDGKEILKGNKIKTEGKQKLALAGNPYVKKNPYLVKQSKKK